MFYVDLFEVPELTLDKYFRWFFVIIDNYIRFGWDYGLRTKDQVKTKQSEWSVFVKKQYEDVHVIRIKIIKSDNGGEFIDGEFQSLRIVKGIHFFSTVVHVYN